MKARYSVALMGMIALLAGVSHGVEIGKAAPGFELRDIEGQSHSLADFRGRPVVLEWTNLGCPFVKKHYGSNNMQKLQKAYTERGVIWLSICSSAAGKQGHFTPEEWKQRIADAGGKATAVLLDPDGKVGRAYGAKTTPHMFVIDAEGAVQYKGAIDSNPSWNPKTIAGAENYVAAALDALLAGKPVPTPATKPYGCSVKY